MSEAEEARRRERAEDNAGGVRVELRVRPTGKAYGSFWPKMLTTISRTDMRNITKAIQIEEIREAVGEFRRDKGFTTLVNGNRSR